MKIHVTLPLFVFFLVIFCVACNRMNPDGYEGNPVRFTAMGSHASETRTSYSGGNVATGQKERIDWKTGDRVKLSSPQAKVYNKSSRPWTLVYSSDSPQYSVAEYVIGSSVTAEGVYSKSGLQNPTPDDNGLQWDRGTHYFYGVYPSTGILESNVITASIPKEQAPASVSTTKTVLPGNVDSTYIHPDMSLAWMWTGQKADAGSSVSLYFTPMITTFQVSVTGLEEEDIEIEKFQLYSENCALQGTYKATVSVSGKVDRTNLSNASVSFSDIPASRTSGSNDTLSFTLPPSTKVSSSKKITVTVFAYPQGASVNRSILDGLSVRFVSPDMNRSLKLKWASDAPGDNAGQWVPFPAGKKINIDGLTLPRQVNPWTFSVSVGNLENEISDVAVAPVTVIPFTEDKVLTPLDEW